MSVCPSPNGEGIESVSFLVDGQMEFTKQFCLRGFESLPLGGDGRGVCHEIGAKERRVEGNEGPHPDSGD